MFEFGPDVFQSLKHPGCYASSTQLLKGRFERVDFVHGTVLEMNEHEAKLLSYETNNYNYIRFDYCIWACGVVRIATVPPKLRI